MNPFLFSDLLSGSLNDLIAPNMLWQISAIMICIFLGKWCAYFIGNRFSESGKRKAMRQMGVRNVPYVLFPLLTLFWLLLAKNQLSKWNSVNIFSIAIPLAVSMVALRFSFHIVRRIFVVPGGQVSQSLLFFEKALAAIVWCGVALYTTGWWIEWVQFFDNIVIPFGTHKISLLVIMQASLSICTTVILSLWVGTLYEEKCMRITAVHVSVRVAMARVGRALFVLIALLVSLSLAGIDLTVLSIFGGALGVGLGFGLQKIASHYVSGFVVLLERSLSIGDMISVDKYSGCVTQINTRYIVLESGDGGESIIPNEMLISQPVQNYSLTNRTVKLATHVTVDYQTDLELLLVALEVGVREVPRILNIPAPTAMLLQFGVDGFVLEVAFWINDPENGKTCVISDVNQVILRILRAQQVKIAFPQRELHCKENIRPSC